MIKKINQNTKTLHIRPNGRSADYITPNFIYGCAGDAEIVIVTSCAIIILMITLIKF